MYTGRILCSADDGIWSNADLEKKYNYISLRVIKINRNHYHTCMVWFMCMLFMVSIWDSVHNWIVFRSNRTLLALSFTWNIKWHAKMEHNDLFDFSLLISELYTSWADLPYFIRKGLVAKMYFSKTKTYWPLRKVQGTHPGYGIFFKIGVLNLYSCNSALQVKYFFIHRDCTNATTE